MAQNSFLKKSRSGLQTLFALVYFQIGAFTVTGIILRNCFRSSLDDRGFVAIAVVFLALIPASTILIVRNRYLSVYASTIAWSRRFPQPVLFVLVLPLLVAVVLGLSYITPWLARVALFGFWRSGNLRGMEALGAVPAMVSLIAVLLDFSALAMMRHFPLGRRGQAARPTAI